MKSQYKERIKQLDREISSTVRRAMDLSLKDCSSWEDYIDAKIKAFIYLGEAPKTRDVISGELNYEIMKLAGNNIKLNRHKRNETEKEIQRRAIEVWEKNPANRYSGEIMEGRALKIQNQKRSRKIRLPKGRRLLHELRSKKEV